MPRIVCHSPPLRSLFFFCWLFLRPALSAPDPTMRQRSQISFFPRMRLPCVHLLLLPLTSLTGPDARVGSPLRIASQVKTFLFCVLPPSDSPCQIVFPIRENAVQIVVFLPPLPSITPGAFFSVLTCILRRSLFLFLCRGPTSQWEFFPSFICRS